MMGKIPIIGYKVILSDLVSGLRGFFSKNCKNEFQNILSEFIQSKYVYFTNSGISAFYIILKTLKKKSSKREVVLPSYTAPSLVVAINKAGLKPVFYDISLEDFNGDIKSIEETVTSNTLCVVCVHMFGIPVRNIEQLKSALPNDVFLIEDCAQAMGSKIGNRLVGSFSHLSVFSFNRGKNLPTYAGGSIFTNSDELTADIESIVRELKEPGLIYEISLFIKFIGLSIAFKPVFYSLLFPFISRFKEDKVPIDFTARHYTSIQAKLGMVLFKRFNESCMKRHKNAMTIIDGLKNTEGIILPKIQDNLIPAFNRLPLVFKDLNRRERVEANLWKTGIETSRMYLRPLHHIFNLGYKKDDFPNATYFAKHLLTLPIHPLLTDNDLDKIINTIKTTK